MKYLATILLLLMLGAYVIAAPEPTGLTLACAMAAVMGLVGLAGVVTR